MTLPKLSNASLETQFSSLATLQSDAKTYAVGTVLNTEKEGFAYECVASGGDLTLDSGQQVDVLPNGNQIFTSALGVTVGVEARDTIQAILDKWADSGIEIINDVDVLVNAALLPRGGCKFVSLGKITANPTFVGQGATGACVAIRHENNMDIYLEHVDGNNVAISAGFNGVTVSGPQASANQRSQYLRLYVNRVENCRRDAAEDLGAGGGKGVSVQFGSVQFEITANISNCDIPYSIEGRASDDGDVYNATFNMRAQDCVYGPMFIGTTGTGSPTEWARYASARVNTQLYDCGNAHGALIFADAAYHIDASVVATGTVTKVLAGTIRGGVINVNMAATNVTNVVDHNAMLPGETNAASRDYVANLKLQVAGSMGGYLYTHDNANASVSSTINVNYSYSGSDFPTLYEYTDNDYRYDITNAASGKRIIGNGNSPAFQSSLLSLQPSTLDLFNNAARVFSDGSNLYFECEDEDLVFRDKNGVNQARIRNGELVVQNQVRWGTSGTIIDAYGTGTPEGVVTASVGSTFRRTDGGASTTLYVKESGTGNIGWVAK